MTFLQNFVGMCFIYRYVLQEMAQGIETWNSQRIAYGAIQSYNNTLLHVT
jgi:hypothetical protein